MEISTSRIGLIGATGKTGSVLLSELLQKNIKLVTLVRDTKRLHITEHENLSISTSIERLILSLLFPETMKAKAESFALLKGSSIRWTLLRCPYIVDDDCEIPKVSLDKCRGKSVSKKSIAAFIIEEIEKEQYLFKSPYIYN